MNRFPNPINPLGTGLRNLIIGSLLAFIGLYAAPVDAPHSVYGFLRRLEVRGLMDRPFLGSLPFQRAEILSLLRSAEADSIRLSPWERQELARYLSHGIFTRFNLHPLTFLTVPDLLWRLLSSHSGAPN